MNIDTLRAKDKLPNHIAFIIDGNGRWARKRGLPRMVGHKFGFDNLRHIVHEVASIGIPYMSVYAFSTENWGRPKDEVEGLMQLFKKSFSEAFNADEDNIRIVYSGDKTRFDEQLQQLMDDTVQKTAKHSGMTLNICLNYGGRMEITKAVNELLASGVTSVTEQDISNHLYTAALPDPDLVVRTSGEIRTSNFMPWQTTYAEWYFDKVMWPSFSKKHLMKALNSYAKRDRRHGKIKG